MVTSQHAPENVRPWIEVRVGQRWRDARGTAEVRGIVDHCAVMRRHGRNLFLIGLDILEYGEHGWELQRP